MRKRKKIYIEKKLLILNQYKEKNQSKIVHKIEGHGGQKVCQKMIFLFHNSNESFRRKEREKKAKKKRRKKKKKKKMAEGPKDIDGYTIEMVTAPVEALLAEKIYQLLLGYGEHYAKNFGPDTRARLHMDDPRNGMVAWIAMKGDEVVSHASVLFDKAHPDHSLLSGVFTAPEHRRKGLSRELTRRTLQTFDEMTDGPGKYCILGTGSPFAARVYHKQGFKDIAGSFSAGQKGYNPDDLGEVIMARVSPSVLTSWSLESYQQSYFAQQSAHLDEASTFMLEPVGRHHLAGLIFLFTGFSGENKLTSAGITSGVYSEEKIITMLNAVCERSGNDSSAAETTAYAAVHRTSGRVHGIAYRGIVYAVPSSPGAATALQSQIR